ncbi:unnamed protein product [Rhizoctonia solani]|uniref:Amidase domain-containing protein n=1 Tax=Rhizoctonia solani TaxID=456999 RepID=A0A8H3HDC9_9AGAM|nr:unnamed protein product [Rhizoctonia solani]
MAELWEDIATQKREDRAKRLKPYADWALGDLAHLESQKNVLHLIHARLTERERSFLSSDVTDLAQRLATRTCTALEVTIAFCKAAYAAQELTNCLSEVMFSQGLARAQELDDHMAETGKTIGPLHGVPISIKDHISIKGEDTAAGYVAWAGKTIAEQDATIVHILREAGAVVYAKTTNPQAVFGPMAHSARDLEFFCQVVSGYEPWNIDPTTLTIPWDSSLAVPEAGKKLVIGLLVDDGVVAPHPPIVESLHKARDALLAAGHEVIDFEPFAHMEAFELVIKLLLPDAGAEMRATLAESGEPAVPNVEALLALGEQGHALTLAQTYTINLERDSFRLRALRHWNGTASKSKSGRPVDAVICPVSYTLAPLHRTGGWAGYTTYWNLLDLPQVVFPFGKPFDSGSWKARTDPLPPRNPVEAIFQAQWDPKKFNGAPVGLSLVGRRLQEERLLGILKQVEDAIKVVN